MLEKFTKKELEYIYKICIYLYIDSWVRPWPSNADLGY